VRAALSLGGCLDETRTGDCGRWPIKAFVRGEVVAACCPRGVSLQWAVSEREPRER